MKSRTFIHLLYTAAALTLLTYAWPNLQFTLPWTAASAFAWVWTALAALFLIAQLHTLFFMNDQKRAELARVKRAKAALWEQRLLRSHKPAAKRAQGT
ncbi:hypothetical protein ACFO9Q_06245 [Paenibacillus sp. GCM10023252]|uniref:hypothetical protein n=1 Tax=Paenibacillus sp. GCM10023252 TaxID=3252649 RepID=UPI00362175D2